MKGESMYRLIGQLDDALIEQALRPAPLRKKSRRAVWTLAVAAALVLTLTVGAFAADVGGLRTTVTMWVRGSQAEMTLEKTPAGTYRIYDQYGELQGEYLVDSADPEQVAREMSSIPEVQLVDDKVMVYYYDQILDITEDFNEEGIAMIPLTTEGERMYLTVFANPGGYYDSFFSPAGYYKGTLEEFHKEK